MNNFLSDMVETIPTVLKNTRFNFELSGWPAATSIFAICGTIIVVYAINNQPSIN